jgi:hypothetical protein
MRAAGDSHLARGLAAARAGLLDEAATDFRALSAENPDSRIARSFLEQITTAHSTDPTATNGAQ